MASIDVKLIGSLVDYIQDIKPYHSKLREFSSEILFNDNLNVNVLDDHHIQVYLQNMWTRDDIGSQSLSIMSEGSDRDRYFKIPAAIWPHFSITDNLSLQTPLGDDPTATIDELIDSNGNGLPDYEDPWTRTPNTSHFPGSDWVPVPAIITDYDIDVRSVSKIKGLGNNLITNGDFTTGVSGWTIGNGSTLSNVGGALRVTNTTSNYGYAIQTIRTEIGKTYTFYATRVGGTGSGVFNITNTNDLSDAYTTNNINASFTFTAHGTTTYIWLNVGGNINGNYYDWDDVSVYVYTTSDVYRFTYNIKVDVDGSIEDAYGFGNYYQAFVDGQDVTYLVSRDDTLGAFDNDQFEEDSYDSKVRTFTISGLSQTFILTDGDIAACPNFVSQSNSWVAQYAFARHRPQVQLNYTNTGRYKVPFHQGSRVYVDGFPVTFGSSYIVETGRNFIQFMPGKYPGPRQTISVNAMTVDRLFISQTRPFDVNPQLINPDWSAFTGAGYDDVNFENLPFDIGFPSLITDYFTFKIDDSYPGRVSPVSFMNSTTLTGKPTLTITNVNPSALNGEIYIVIATGLWTFSVQQISPYLGPVQVGSFKQEFVNDKISFIVDKTWTPYYMVPDINSYSSFSQVYNVYSFKTVDPTDHILNLDLLTEHGVVIDPDLSSDKIHKPVQFSNLGSIRKVVNNNNMTRSWIGVETYDTPNSQGVIINNVYPASQADLAGLMVGDIIMSIGDVAINSTIDLLHQVDNTLAGTDIVITAVRESQAFTFSLSVTDQLADLEYYEFVLDEIPARGVYYELRIEQTGGLNPRVHASIDDEVIISVLEDGNTFIYSEVYNSRNPNNADITDVDTDPITIINDTSRYVDTGYWDLLYVV
jgi:hypothetical protein